jgi:anaerobic selenocysteine-containing dehydrogenase
VILEYVKHFDPKTTEEITWAPAPAIESLAREIAKVPGTTLFAIGMGPNQFFNNDNKDRTQFLLAALTGNIGKLAGNIGSYAGNYRVAMFNGVPQYIFENPFDIELDPAKPARPKAYWRAESAHTTIMKITPQDGQDHDHRQNPHADADQVALVRQRQFDLGQRQVALQHGGQRAAENRDDRGARMVVVDLLRMGGCGFRGGQLGGAEISRYASSQTVPDGFTRTWSDPSTRGDISVWRWWNNSPSDRR